MPEQLRSIPRCAQVPSTGGHPRLPTTNECGRTQGKGIGGILWRVTMALKRPQPSPVAPSWAQLGPCTQRIGSGFWDDPGRFRRSATYLPTTQQPPPRPGSGGVQVWVGAHRGATVPGQAFTSAMRRDFGSRATLVWPQRGRSPRVVGPDPTETHNPVRTTPCALVMSRTETSTSTCFGTAGRRPQSALTQPYGISPPPVEGPCQPNTGSVLPRPRGYRSYAHQPNSRPSSSFAVPGTRMESSAHEPRASPSIEPKPPRRGCR